MGPCAFVLHIIIFFPRCFLHSVWQFLEGLKENSSIHGFSYQKLDHCASFSFQKDSSSDLAGYGHCFQLLFLGQYYDAIICYVILFVHTSDESNFCHPAWCYEKKTSLLTEYCSGNCEEHFFLAALPYSSLCYNFSDCYVLIISSLSIFPSFLLV